MLRISKLTDYATVILSFLALDPLEILSATTIAKEIHLSIQTISKLLKMLTNAGLVVSYRGTGGGYQLGRPIHEITIADVVLVIEGQLALTECCELTNTCSLDSLCVLKDNWKSINKMILNALGKVTLHDMMQPSLPQQPMMLKGIPIKLF